MGVLVACDSFKGTLTAAQATSAIARGLKRRWPDTRTFECPLADGGEGTGEILGRALGLREEFLEVRGPLGEPAQVAVRWAARHAPGPRLLGCGDRRQAEVMALIEVAECSGYGLVPPSRRNPLWTTSFGVGEAMCHAQARGATLIVVCLGGSATIDGGLGCLQAMGARIEGLSGYATGATLLELRSVDLSGVGAKFCGTRVAIASDVRNPLLGARGAARAFGPQKGAAPELVEAFEAAMQRYARMLSRAASLPSAESHILAQGAGAAGGLGFALQVALGATYVSGAELVMDSVELDKKLEGVRLVVTGEGRLDAGSFEGKVVSGVLARARQRGVPVVALAGQTSLTPSEWQARGLRAVHRLPEPSRGVGEPTPDPGTALEQLAASLDWAALMA